MIEIYDISDHKREDPIFILKLGVLERIHFELHNKGVMIDLYGTSRVYPSHIGLIMNALENGNKDEIEFYNFLTRYKKEDKGFIIEGD
ncbi:hypothetical protein POV27_13290 [Aureisphaera galaxeae]|uniref:hypothetical protein n=1 Tax=Aureisphaera galaxeae TaxID=1538023 RepID=UPI00234FE612|nr:hypothetical protein [Aureisphaera galaxeae]MDC8005030.1 hypothetical protein [Aureisphaera galaxeae]